MAVTPSVIQQKFNFVMNALVLLISLAALRLQWRPAAALYASVLAGAIAVFVIHFPVPLPVLDARFSLLPLIVATGALSLIATIGEGLARRAWWANYQLALNATTNAARVSRPKATFAFWGKLSAASFTIWAIRSPRCRWGPAL